MEIKEMSAMNVIPFVDIMLVLLTIVLVSATFIAIGKIPVNLPSAQGEPAKEIVRIYISKEGELFLNESPISRRELEERLDSLSRESQIFVGADRMVTVDQLILYLELLRSRGFSRVSLGVREK